MVLIETDRLQLRNFRPGDWETLQALVTDYQVSPAARYEDPWPTLSDVVKAVTTLPAKAGSFSGHARRYFRPRCVPKAPSGPDAEY